MKKKITQFFINYKTSLFIILTCIFSVFLLQFITRNNTHFAEWYATTIYPIYINTISRCLSFLPFSMSELLLILLIIYVLIKVLTFFYKLFKCIKQKSKISLNPTKPFIHTLVFLSTLLLVYTLTCGINYHRHTFSSYLGLKIEESNSEHLEKLCLLLIEKANEYSNKIPLDKNGLSTLPKNAKRIAVNAMKNLGETYPSLSGYYPNPKPIIFSEIMSYQSLGGIYSPFTVEANYNNHMPASDIPETMCHELSHLRGFMREDEAEFIAYLACIGSDQIEFQYSGIMTGLTYSLNAVYDDLGSNIYTKLYDKLSPQVKKQLSNNYSYWDSYKGPIAELEDKVNDNYLKANSQEDGVRSYGRMIDLLLAYYKDDLKTITGL